MSIIRKLWVVVSAELASRPHLVAFVQVYVTSISVFEFFALFVESFVSLFVALDMEGTVVEGEFPGGAGSRMLIDGVA